MLRFNGWWGEIWCAREIWIGVYRWGGRDEAILCEIANRRGEKLGTSIKGSASGSSSEWGLEIWVQTK